MEEEKKVEEVKKQPIDVKKEATYNLIAGFFAGVIGYLLGAWADSTLLSVVLFFGGAYVGYNYRQTLTLAKPIFVKATTAFWRQLKSINPHPLVALPIALFCGLWVFATSNNGIKASSLGLSLDKVIEGVSANYAWLKTGVNPLDLGGVHWGLFGRVTAFIGGCLFALFVFTAVWFTIGWSLEGFFYLCRHPIISAKAIRSGIKFICPRPLIAAVIVIACASSMHDFFLQVKGASPGFAMFITICYGFCFWLGLGWVLKGTFWLATHPLVAAKEVWGGIKEINPCPIISALLALPLALQGYNWVITIPHGMHPIIAGICAGLLFFITWLFFGFAVAPLKQLYYAIRPKLTVRNVTRTLYLSLFYCTVGFFIMLGKAVALTIIGIHSRRRLACGLSAAGGGTLYLMLVPFAVAGIPVSILAIGCGVSLAGVCALTALALDGDKVKNALERFKQKPLASFAGINS